MIPAELLTRLQVFLRQQRHGPGPKVRL